MKRKNLTYEELEKLSGAELARLNFTKEEATLLKEINIKRNRQRAERTENLRKEEQPIIDEIKSSGINVTSVWDMVNGVFDYTEALPVLLKHLILPYSDRTREGIARSLAVKNKIVIDAWDLLVDQYKKTPFGNGKIAPNDKDVSRLGAKDGLACALAASVTEANMNDLMELIKDPSQGESRIILLSPLKHSKLSWIKDAVIALSKDPELKMEINSWADSSGWRNRQGWQ